MWAALNEDLRAALVLDNLVTPGALATFSDLTPAEVAEAVADFLCTSPDSLDDDFVAAMGQFDELIRAATGPARAARARTARTTVWEIAEAAGAEAQRAKRARVDALFDAVVPRANPPAPTGASGRWPTGRRRRIAAAGNTAEARDVAEREELNRQGDALATLLREACLPIVLLAEETMNPEVTLRRGARGRRASTIRQYLRTLRLARSWLVATFGVPFPTKAAQVLDYLNDLEAHDCAPTAPRSYLTALGFLEQAGSVDVNLRLSEHPAVKATVDDISQHLALPGSAPRSGKALQLFATILVSFELTVVDPGAPRYKRAFLWFKLVKHWACLRWNDTEGVASTNMTWSAEAGLKLRVDRTKTTGPGKAVRVLTAIVDPACFLVARQWLRQGWEIWSSEGFNFERPYLLPLPTPDLEGVVEQPARYFDALCMTRQVLAEAMLPVPSGCQAPGTPGAAPGTPSTSARPSFVPSDQLILLPGAQVLWSEHSERGDLPTWTTHLGYGKWERDCLGRWRPEGSDQYLRQMEIAVRRVQRAVAAAARQGLGRKDTLGEADALDDVVRRLRARDYPEDDISQLRARLGSALLPPSYPSEVHDITEEDGGATPAAQAASPTEVGGGPLPEEPPALAEDLFEFAAAELEVSTPPGSPRVPAEVIDYTGHYVVSVSARTRFRRLHCVGQCWRRPGQDYKEFELVEDLSADRYDAICKDCWPKWQDLQALAEASSAPVEVASSDEESSVCEFSMSAP